MGYTSQCGLDAGIYQLQLQFTGVHAIVLRTIVSVMVYLGIRNITPFGPSDIDGILSGAM